MKPWRMVRASSVALAIALAATALLVTRGLAAGKSAAAPPDPESPWAAGAHWLQLRAGYAKAQGESEPDGAGGYGFGYSHMESNRISLGINIQHDLLGTFGAASKIELPVVLEMLWHYDWSSGLHPYFGGGVGAAYRKTYRSGDDQSSWQPMYSVSVGTDFPVGKRNVLGLDLRAEGVSSDQMGSNPVFGTEEPRSVHWSFKLTYALAYHRT